MDDIGAKDVVTIIHIGKDDDLIIDHIRERTNIGKIKNHDHEPIGEISGNEKGVMYRCSGLIIFRCKKSMTQCDKEVAETASDIAKLDGAEFKTSG